MQNFCSLFFLTTFAVQEGKARMATIEGFVKFVYFVNIWARELGQSEVCQNGERTTNAMNRPYRLVSPSTTQIV